MFILKRGNNTEFDKLLDILLFKGLIILCFVLFDSCSSRISNQLSIIESNLENDPVTALSELQKIDQSSLFTTKEKAKYALLLSMALEKNYVDKTSFEVLQPAIDYYLKWGSPTNKLKTLLYQGNIYLHCGDKEAAMRCYTNALDYAHRCQDKYCLSRVYGSQAYVYRSLYNYDKSIECAKKAASVMKEIGDTTNYFLELNSIVSGLLILDKKEEALSLLEECDSLSVRRRYSSQRDYYRNRIEYSRKYLSKEQSLEWIDKYLRYIPANQVNWNVIAYAYYNADDITRAEVAILNYDKYDGKQSAGVEAVRAQILEERGKYQEALSHYKQYIHLTDSSDLVAYRQNTRAVPEMHELDSERERMRRGRLFFAIMLAAALLLLILLTVIYRQRMEMSRLKMSQLEEEFETLRVLRMDESAMNEEARAVLDGRFALLNRFFKAYISEDWEEERKASREVEALLSDRQNFAASTRKAFEASRPAFIQFLVDSGLDDKEINYCCLYAIGLKGNEIGVYMKDSRHYHVSSGIRSKLGLGPNDTNLGPYLRSLPQSEIEAKSD